MKRISVFLTLLLVMMESTSFAQKALGVNTQPIRLFNCMRYTTKDGLVSNNIKTLSSSHDGLIWIGTDDGVNMFDGYSFKEFLPTLSGEKRLNGKNICDIKELTNGNIIMATSDGGVSVYDRFSDMFKSEWEFETPTENLDFSHAYGMCRLGDDVYVSFNGFIVCFNLKTRSNTYIKMNERPKYTGVKLDRTKMVVVDDNRHIVTILGKTRIGVIDSKYNTLKEIVLRDKLYINDICPVDSSSVYLATTKGLYIYNIIEKKITRLYYFSNVSVEAITRNPYGSYWIAYNNKELAKWISNSNSVRPVRFSNSYLNNQSVVREMVEADDGILWIATNNAGLIKADTKRAKIYTYDIKCDLPSNYITHDIFAASKLRVWAAIGNDGIAEINLQDSTLRHIKVPHRNVYSVLRRLNGELLIGTTRGLMRHDPETDMFTNIPFPESMTDSLDRIIVNEMCEDCLGNIWLATQVGMYSYNGVSINSACDDNSIVDFTSVYEDKDGRIWAGSRTGGYVKEHSNSCFERVKLLDDSLDVTNTVFSFADIDSAVVIGTSNGIRFFDKKLNCVIPTVLDEKFENIAIYSIVNDGNGVLWLSSNRGVYYYKMATNEIHLFNNYDGLSFLGNECRKFSTAAGRIFFGHASLVNTIRPNEVLFNTRSAKSIVTYVKYGQADEATSATMVNDSVFETRFMVNGSLKIGIASSDFTTPSRNEFKYRVDDGAWFKLHNSNEIHLPGYLPQMIKVEILSSNSDKIWGKEITTIYIHLVPPMWMSAPAIIFYVIMFLAIVWLLLDLRFRNINRKIKRVEGEARAKKVVEAQRNRLAKIHKDQTDSINYAKRIQDAIMSKEESVSRRFSKIFVFYKPKDIVSGDFYSFYYRDNKTFIIDADCTGHGVPGAFLSILGIEHLYNIIMKQKIDDAGQILTQLHRDLHETVFKNESQNEEFNEGMDLSISVVYHNEKKINFAGAMNDLYLIRNNEITSYRGSRHSIGTNVSIAGEEDRFVYESQTVECQSGDIFYMFSDGFVDQFGGPEQKKFKHRRFKQMLLNIHKLPARDQRMILNQKHNEWKQQNEQTDDISVIGFEPWA